MNTRACLLGLTVSLHLGCSSDDATGPTSTPGPDAALPYPPPAPDDCITSVAPGKQTLTCSELSFDLTVPAVCLERACGLIFDVHGFGMNASLQELHTKLSVLADAPGYIVVQPSAPGAVLASSWSSQNDPQILEIMQSVISVWHVNTKRVHFTGYSMGGWMTWRFVCAHSDIIASAAPIAAGSQANGGSCAFNDTERPARELDIFYTHGTTDGLVPFATATAQRDALIAAWGMQQKEVVNSGPDYNWVRYENANGTTFEFAQHDWDTSFVLGQRPLAGHCFPGSGDLLGCGADTAFKWGEAVLDFFIRHPMP
jgi:pimeloyl-ACP methyl ester carboxylesterase